MPTTPTYLSSGCSCNELRTFDRMKLTGNRQMAEVETEVGLRRVEKVSRLKGESQCPPRVRAGGEAEARGASHRLWVTWPAARRCLCLRCSAVRQVSSPSLLIGKYFPFHSIMNVVVRCPSACRKSRTPSDAWFGIGSLLQHSLPRGLLEHRVQSR